MTRIIRTSFLAGAGSGGGMMMLFVLTTFLGYQMHMAVGTSVFIMTFTALTGGIVMIITSLVILAVNYLK